MREEDCGTTHGLPMTVAERDENGNLVLVKAADGGPYSRLLAQDVLDPADGKTVLYHAGDALSMDVLNDLVAHGVEQVVGRSVLTCESKRGVCAKCYGWSLATNKLVDVGEAVGIVAAQSIGEPWHAADASFLPLRWRRLGIRYHAGPSSCHRVVRSPYA